MRIYGDSTSINDLISGAMEKLKTIVDSSTIVGEQIVTPSGDTIIPISKVTVGFVVGGGEYADLSARRVANHFPMSGGSSGGMSVSPVGFLVLHENGDVDFVNVENKSLYQTVLNMFNSLLAKMEKKAKEEECGCEQEVSGEDVEGCAEDEILQKQDKNEQKELKKEEKQLKKQEKKIEKQRRKKAKAKSENVEDLRFANEIHFDEAEDDEE